MGRYYEDLNGYLSALEKSGKLFRIKKRVSKETDITPIARLQFRGLEESQRYGFLFENVTDAKGRDYKVKVATGVYSSSMDIYALGIKSEAPTRESIQKSWEQALLRPVPTELVDKAPVQDVVVEGDKLMEDGNGIDALPVPVEVPGYSGQIRTSTQIITKSAKTGIPNMGEYSAHIFGKKKLLWEIHRGNHGFIHWKEWKELGKPMPAAIIIGGVPSYYYTASAKVPYGVDELTVSGGFSGEPVKTVKCKTVDLEVPANVDIVIEGLISTEFMEPGNSFGEFTGYMATDIELRPVFDVTAVTMRRDAVYVHIMSQFPPSESTKVRQIASENLYLKFLKYDCNIPGIIDVFWNEMSQPQWCIIKIKKINNAHSWQVLNLAANYNSSWGKFFIVVDEDIDIRNPDSVIWAMSWRVQPARDIKVITGRMPGLDPSGYRYDAPHEEKEYPGDFGSSGLLIDATTKFPYPPTSLPRKEFMEKAIDTWKELGLPKLDLVEPWYGYELGYWPKEYKKDAEDILKGEHYKIGERLEKQRQKV